MPDDRNRFETVCEATRRTTPQDHHKALGIVLLHGRRKALFLKSEVSL